MFSQAQPPQPATRAFGGATIVDRSGAPPITGAVGVVGDGRVSRSGRRAGRRARRRHRAAVVASAGGSDIGAGERARPEASDEASLPQPVADAQEVRAPERAILPGSSEWAPSPGRRAGITAARTERGTTDKVTPDRGKYLGHCRSPQPKVQFGKVCQFGSCSCVPLEVRRPRLQSA
jgi:hypothetical protein